jgi:hypothetical protein
MEAKETLARVSAKAGDSIDGSTGSTERGKLWSGTGEGEWIEQLRWR